MNPHVYVRTHIDIVSIARRFFGPVLYMSGIEKLARTILLFSALYVCVCVA